MPTPIDNRLVPCTLLPARLRTAYHAVLVLVNRADGTTAAERAPYLEDRTVEVSFAEEAAGRQVEAHVVIAATGRVGVVERVGREWLFRAARSPREVVRVGELECDGQRRADLLTLNEDAPGRVLLRSSGPAARTRRDALAKAGYVVG